MKGLGEGKKGGGKGKKIKAYPDLVTSPLRRQLEKKGGRRELASQSHTVRFRKEGGKKGRGGLSSRGPLGRFVR